MNKFPENSPDGLIQGIGQDLLVSASQPSAPIQCTGGQWVFRFTHSEPCRVSVNVSVVFGSPFPMTIQLYSEMDQCQVESLRDWLSRILTEMGRRPEKR